MNLKAFLIISVLFCGPSLGSVFSVQASSNDRPVVMSATDPEIIVTKYLKAVGE